MKSPTTRVLIAGTLCVAIGLASCSSDSDSGGADSKSTTTDAVVDDTISETATSPTPSSDTDSSEPTSPSSVEATPSSEAAEPVETLDDAVLATFLSEAVAEYPDSPGHLMWVISPEYTGGAAVGTLELGGSEPLEVDTPVRIASVTKTYVAASVLRLAEMGRLTLDDPISRHLSPTYLDLLSADGYDIEAITVRHLLTHTSGIADYAGYEENYEGKFQDLIEADPEFEWNRELEVQFAMDNYDPLAEPGAEFHYADTGYVLLGDLLEQALDVPSYGAALSELLGFEELGLTSTFVERLDREAPDKPLGHQYIGTLDYTNIDPGQDMYGGGGIVSTTREVSIFFDALLGGEIFDKPETLAEMITPPADAEPGSEQASEGLGIFLVDGPDGETCYSHSGYGGTTAIACPDSDITLTVVVQQVEAPGDDYVDPVDRVFAAVS